MNLGNLDFDIVSDFGIRISSLGWICSTFVENIRQIQPFYAKQTQFYAFFTPKRRLCQKTKPIQTQFKANLTQNKPNLSQYKPKTKPILSSEAVAKEDQTQFKPNKAKNKPKTNPI